MLLLSNRDDTNGARQPLNGRWLFQGEATGARRFSGFYNTREHPQVISINQSRYMRGI